MPRPRIGAQLEKSLGKTVAGGNILLMMAPAGYGKSVAIAQWFQRSGMPTAWLCLDASDNDPVTLLRDLIEALKHLTPRTARWHAGLVVPAVRNIWPPEDVQHAAAALANEISANVTRPSTLALTGIAELAEESGGFALLNAVLGRSVDHLRVIIETREPSALNISQALAQGRVAGVGAEDLRLEDGELAALLALVDAPEDADYRQALTDLCAGWITGVLLATDALWPQRLPQCARFMRSAGEGAINHAAVTGYLAHEVLASLSAEELAFALKVAPLNYMTTPLCERLLDEPNARDRLTQLDQHTGLLTRVGRRPAEPRYQFQPFLREALLRRLEGEPGGSALLRALRDKAGILLAEAGDQEEAIKQFHLAGDYEQIIAVIEAARGTLLRAGRGATLERWLRLLPDGVRAGRPHLVVLQAELTRQLGHTEEAATLAQHACALNEPLARENPLLSAQALAVRAEVCFVQGDYAVSRSASETALALIPDDADELQARLRFVLAQCHNKAGRPEVAERLLTDAEWYCQRQGDLWLLARVAYFRSQIALMRGDYQAIARYSSEALRVAQEAGDEIIAISARLQLGAAAYYLGQTGRAMEHLEAALRQSEDDGYQAGKAYALVNLGDVALHSGCYAQASAHFDQALQAMKQQDDQRLVISTYALYVIALALNGELRRAAEKLSILRRLRHRSSERATDETQMVLAGAILAWRQQNRRKAAKRFDLAGQLAIHSSAAGDFANVQMYRAALLLEDGVDDAERQAIELLEKACGVTLTLADQRLEQAAQVWLNARFWPEVRKALAQITHPVAERAIALMATLASEGHTVEAPFDPPESDGYADQNKSQADAKRRLCIYTLGEPRILLGSEVILLWKHPQARDLLLFLAEQKKLVSKDMIHEELWPEHDRGKFERALKKARYHLRKLMGYEPLTQEGDMLSVRDKPWLDSQAFTELVNQGKALAGKRSLTEAARAFGQALSLWRGSFLPDHYEDWAVLRRDELQKDYTRCLEGAACVELGRRRWESAAQLCYRLLEADSYNEDAYRGLMTAYALNGDYNAAAQAYRRCEAVLREELHARPDAKTQKLWQSIQRQMAPPDPPEPPTGPTPPAPTPPAPPASREYQIGHVVKHQTRVPAGVGARV
ncbi:MAG TPA: BTAD domain-containing putative transcriptional regulator [Ktedonobacterales bacterium]|nr:BTAD domain-containing putative transcriptional regulator [Ktedonobacterales bacterium]